MSKQEKGLKLFSFWLHVKALIINIILKLTIFNGLNYTLYFQLLVQTIREV